MNRKGNPRPKGVSMWVKATHSTLSGMLLGKLVLTADDIVGMATMEDAALQKIIKGLRLVECQKYTEKRKGDHIFD